MNFEISEIDYIAVCTGYTSRLLHEENQKVKCDELSGRTVYKIKEPELKFWPLGYTIQGLETERLLGEGIENSPMFLENKYDKDDPEEVEGFLCDYDPVKTLIIDNMNMYLLHEDAMDVVNAFYPKYEKELYGSIIFASAVGKFDLADWREVSQSLDIGFCAGYDPTNPYKIKIVHDNGKTMLILRFDCESG